jgi:hypothetical protein
MIEGFVSGTMLVARRIALATKLIFLAGASGLPAAAQDAGVREGTEWSGDDFRQAIADMRSPEGDREGLRMALLRQLNPFHEDIDLLDEDFINHMLGHGIAVVGCAAGGIVVGFYSPLLHVWLAVELDLSAPPGETLVNAATLGQGFPSVPGRMLWWPSLVSENLSITGAMQLATATQVDAFQAWFSGDVCPEFPGGAFSPNAALTQLAEIDAEWPDFSRSLKPEFVSDLSERSEMDFSGWEVFERLPGTDRDWVVIFLSPDHPGAAIIGHWERRTSGNVYYAGHEVVAFLPEIDAPHEEIAE